MLKPAACIDLLEPRRMLAGITLVTHGYQSNGVLPQWVDRMAEAVDRRVEPWSSSLWADAARYRMQMTQSSGNVSVSSFTRTHGPAPASSRTGEAVIVLDWASISGLSGPSVTLVAQAVATQLLASGPALGFAVNATALPLHLIGHSRGAVLMAELSRALAQSGVWVDHLTTLDAYPISQDPNVSITDNVVYADNFYETTDFIVHGSPINGANNVGPLSLPGGSSLAHSDVHSYYHGTIGRAATGDGDVTINNAWYGNSALTRSTIGYDWSRASGATRPAAGVSSLAGGSAQRTHVNPTNTLWPNVGSLSISGGTNGAFEIGQQVTLSARYQMPTSSGEIDYYLDTDTNLFNGFSRTLTIATNLAPTTAPPDTASRSVSFNWATQNTQPGLYYVNAVITDGTGHIRVATLPQPLFVTTDGFEVVTKRWSDDTANHDWSDPRNWSPGAPPVATDRASVDFGTANLASTAPVGAIELSGAAVVTSAATQNVQSLNAANAARFNLSAGANRVVVTQSLRIAGTSTVDLFDNDLIVDYTGASSLASIVSNIIAARHGGAWDAPGLTSTAAKNASPQNVTLGAIEASDYTAASGLATFSGEPIDATAVLIKFTYYGDADFNGKVDGADYAKVDTTFNGQSTGNIGGWFNGDFDYNDKVDGADYALIDAAFNSQGAPLRPITKFRAVIGRKALAGMR